MQRALCGQLIQHRLLYGTANLRIAHGLSQALHFRLNVRVGQVVLILPRNPLDNAVHEVGNDLLRAGPGIGEQPAPCAALAHLVAGVRLADGFRALEKVSDVERSAGLICLARVTI